MQGTVRQYCTFFLGGMFFGVEVVKIQEILRYQDMTEVPLANNVIRGLINLRGQVVTAIDLRRRLDMNDDGRPVSPMNVVVKRDECSVSFLVDSIGDVTDVSDADFEDTPETVKGIARQLISGAYKLKDRLLLILDIEKILEF